MVGLLVQRLHLRFRDCARPGRVRANADQVVDAERNRRRKDGSGRGAERAEPAKDLLASKLGGGKGVRRSIGTLAGFAGGTNQHSAAGYPKRRDFTPDQERSWEVKGPGAVVGKGRRHGEKPGGRNTASCFGRDSEASVGVVTVRRQAGAIC